MTSAALARPDSAVRWLGHATCVIDVGGQRLLTDPLLGPRAGPLIRRGRLPLHEEWAGADAVLLSHLHHDHAHVPSLRAARGTVLGPPPTALWALRQRLRGRPVTDGWYALDPAVAVRTVPAVHGDRPMPHRANDAVGFVVRWSDRAADHDDDRAAGVTRRLWFAGDTALFSGMSDIPELAGGAIDMALVPVGGWGPRLSGGHLDPSRAAEACALVGARAAIPIHWGTFHAPLMRDSPRGWMDRGGPEFIRELGARSPDTVGVLLAPGDPYEL